MGVAKQQHNCVAAISVYAFPTFFEGLKAMAVGETPLARCLKMPKKQETSEQHFCLLHSMHGSWTLRNQRADIMQNALRLWCKSFFPANSVPCLFGSSIGLITRGNGGNATFCNEEAVCRQLSFHNSTMFFG